ncbi:TolC family protein [Pseudomonas sp. NA-150]|uniref:TolC family protein n=1 Tax=Pseudomonas sp. NA-150 TaxID=3367525 RepID=UPI0037C74EF2
MNKASRDKGLQVGAVSRRRRLWIPAALAFSAHTLCSAQSLRPAQPSMALVRVVALSEQRLELSLADAVYLGLRDNRSIRSAYLQRIAHKFDLRVAEDAFTPRTRITHKAQANRGNDERHRDYTLTPSATVTNEWGTRFSLSWAQHLNRADRGGRKLDNGLELGIVQPLLRGAGRDIVTAPRRLARLSESSNKLQLNATVAQTITQIVTAYRELVRAQEQQRIAQTALARSRQLLEVNQALITAGRMAPFEQVQTEADLASQELGAEETANQLDASRRELLRLLALDLGTVLRASEPVDAKRLDIDQQQALQLALTRQPHYLQQLLAAEQADINLLLAQDQQLWDVSLVGGASQARNRHLDIEPRQAEQRWGSYVGIQLEIPLGDLSARQAVVRAHVAVQDQALRQAEARQMLEREVGDAVRDMGTRWRQYEIAQRLRELSRRKLDIERDKLQVGRSSNFQVLSFEGDLRQAENSALNAQIAYLNAQTQLDERLGMTLQSWEIALND